jgi:hypothetical protein
MSGSAVPRLTYRGALCLALASALLAGSPLLPPESASAHPDSVRATFGQPVRDASGHVDSWATIDRVRTLGAYTYAYLIKKPTDWDDLRLDFAPAANAVGMEVWVYLLPPGICPGGDTCAEYEPYHDDYEAWVDAIARLSKQYPVVTAWVMDDFDSHQSQFTVSSVDQIRRSSRAIQPLLDFYPIVYYRSMNAEYLDRYAALADGFIMPYNDHPYRNTLWTGTLAGQLNTASSVLAARGKRLVLMVYAWPLSNTQVTPDVDYVRRVTATGMEQLRAGKIAGVIQYQLPLAPPGRPQSGDANPSRGSGKGALLFTVRAEQATDAGDYASATTQVSLLPSSNVCLMDAWHYDNRGVPSPTGHHYKQILVNGTLVWQQDVATDAPEWRQTPLINLTPFIPATHQASLTLRLFERAGVSNFNTRVRFDDIHLTGCQAANTSFEQTSGWSLSRVGGPVLGGLHLYDPVYSDTVFAAVKDLYRFN